MTLTDRSAPQAPDGETRRQITIYIPGARFAGTPKFSVRFTINLLGFDALIRLDTEGWPRKGHTRFGPVDLIDFGQPAGQLATELSETEATKLVQSLFGTRLAYAPAGPSRLSLGADLRWRLHGGSNDRFHLEPRLDPKAPPSPVSFMGLAFGPSLPEAGPFDPDVVDRAFAKKGSHAVGSSIPAALSGVSEGQPSGGSSIGLGHFDNNVVQMTNVALDRVALQILAGMSEVLSGVSCASALVRVNPGPNAEGPFSVENGLLVRFGQDGVSGLARLPIAGKASEIVTSHGRFIVEPADPQSPAPEAASSRPGVVLSTQKGQLSSFAVSTLLRQALLPFPAAEDLPSRPFFHRLDFAGQACSFVLDRLHTDTPSSGGSIIRVGILAAGIDKPIKARIRLDQAKLRVVRPDDLLSLAFTFSGLALERTTEGWDVAALAEGQCDVHLAEPVNALRREGGKLAGPLRPGESVDSRPVLVVEFPPQHVAERAYLRQIDDGEDPPDVVMTDDDLATVRDALATLDAYRQGQDVDVDARIAARRQMQCVKLARSGKVRDQAGSVDKKAQDFNSAQVALQTAVDSKADSQKIAEARAEVDVAAQALEAARAAVDADTGLRQFIEAFEARIDEQLLSARWPEDQKVYAGSEWLDPDVRRFARRLAADPPSGPGRKPAGYGKLPPVNPDDPDYRAWVDAYEKWGDRLFGGLPRYCGPDTVRTLVDAHQLSDAQLAALLAGIDGDIGGPEHFERNGSQTPARLSGPTRLAFRINCDDVEGGGRFPFTLEALTNWSRFDLSVIRRAEKLQDFDRSGRLPPRWARREVLDTASILAHQEIHPAFGPDALLHDKRGVAAQRMAEVVAAASTRPRSFETAIELPFRLTLSPAQDARWRTPRLPPTKQHPVPLWQAVLDEDSATSAVRAVWSEDFRPEVFGTGGQPPVHGPWAPWGPPTVGDSGGPYHAAARFRASLDAGDRHELVALTSMYGMPALGRGKASASPGGEGDQIEPPPGYGLRDLLGTGDAIYMPRPLSVSELALSALGGSLTLDTHFEPPASPLGLDGRSLYQALGIEQWRHTAVLGRDISVQVVYKGFLFPLGHRVSYVKTTERRFMRHPDGGPVAYLIQRLYLQIGHPRKTFPALGQADGGRCFPPRLVNILTRRSPDLVDPYDRSPAIWGAPSLPAIPAGATPVYAQEFPNGAVALSDNNKTTLPGLVFWPRTSTSADATVRFEMQFDEASGSVKMPLLFVDNAAAQNKDTLRAVTAYYNNHERTPRSVDHNGVPRRYAQENKAGDATFETLQWTLLAEGGPGLPDNGDFAPSSPLEGADQPPFYPKLDSCRIRINQVGKFTGAPAPEVTARYYKDYVKYGFDSDSQRTSNAAAVFLLIDKDSKSGDLPALRFGASGDRAAGLGRPEQKMGALSPKGPIGTDHPFDNVEKTATAVATSADVVPPDFSKFDPKAFFGNFGKLLGILDLGEVIRVVAGLAGQPELAETIDYVSDQAWALVCQTILQPMHDLLVRLDQTWRGAAARVSGDAAQQIEVLFKDLKDARAQLLFAVDTALASKQPSIDQQAQSIGAVYEKARVFINALQRLAADPFGQVQVEIRNRLDGFVRDLIGIQGNAITALITVLETTKDRALGKIGDVTLKILNQIYRSSWPPLIELDLDPNRLGVLARELAKPVLIDEFTAAYTQANTLGSAVRDLIKKRLDNATVTWREDERNKVVNAIDRLIEAGKTPLYGTLARPLDDLLAARVQIIADLQNLIRRAGPQALADVIVDLAPVLTSLSSAIEALPVFGAQNCEKAVDLSAMVTDVFGVKDAELKPVAILLECFQDPGNCAPVKDKSAIDQILTGLKELSASDGSQLNDWIVQFRTANLESIADFKAKLERLKGLGMPADDSAQAIKDCKAGDYQAVGNSLRKMSELLHRRAALAGVALALVTDVLRRIGQLPPPSAATKDDDKRVTIAVLRVLLGFARLVADEKTTQALIDKLRQTLPDPPDLDVSAFIGFMVNVENTIDALEKDGADLTKLRQDLDSFIRTKADDAVKQAREKLQAVFQAADSVAFSAEFLTWTIVADVEPVLEGALLVLQGVYEAVGTAVTQGQVAVDSAFAEIDKSQLLALALKPLKERLLATLAKNDIGGQITTIEKARSVVQAINDSGPPDLSKFKAAKDGLNNVVSIVNSPDNAIVALARDLGDLLKAILRGDVAKLIVVDAPRREIEALIRDLIPHKATMSYRLDTELQPFAEIFIPDEERGARRLTIDTTAVVDLLNGDHMPQTTVKGTLDPFNIHLFGSSFDIVTLKFKAATFGSLPGGPFRFGLDLETVELGEMVEFLKALQDYLTPSDGNGFYLRPATGSPGIEVGYGLNLGTISLGPVSFINVGLNAGCRLPFDDRSALFTISLSRPDAPFLISAGIYGGGGFLGLIADGRSIVGFEASFEFGGVAAFSFGPLTGIGRLTTGIYLRKLYQYTTLEGFFFCGGSARIACFGISASLSVRISMQPGGAMTGSAIFSFSFSIGFAHLDFHITVFKTQSKLGSQSAMRSPARPVMLARASLSDSETLPCASAGPRIYAETMSPDRNWTVYRSYFDLDLVAAEDML